MTKIDTFMGMWGNRLPILAGSWHRVLRAMNMISLERQRHDADAVQSIRKMFLFNFHPIGNQYITWNLSKHKTTSSKAMFWLLSKHVAICVKLRCNLTQNSVWLASDYKVNCIKLRTGFWHVAKSYLFLWFFFSIL